MVRLVLVFGALTLCSSFFLSLSLAFVANIVLNSFYSFSDSTPLHSFHTHSSSLSHTRILFQVPLNVICCYKKWRNWKCCMWDAREQESEKTIIFITLLIPFYTLYFPQYRYRIVSSYVYVLNVCIAARFTRFGSTPLRSALLTRSSRNFL